MNSSVLPNLEAEDRQSRRVGRGPTVGSQVVRLQIEYGSLGRLPSVVRSSRAKKLVQHPIDRVDHDAVPITAPIELVALHVGQ